MILNSIQTLKIRVGKRFVLFGFIVLLLASCTSEQEGKHLFILSGQSNMEALPLEASFTPAVTAKFGAENILVVKDAESGQPIRRWYRDWKPPIGDELMANPDLYDRLLAKVNSTIGRQHIETVTFIWMQGERDAREQLGEVYEGSLKGLYKQLSNDLNRKDVNFIIGRLSDFDLKDEQYPHWTMVRNIQMKVAEFDSRFEWVNTDDLNDGFNSKGAELNNDLHMSVEGYELMGERFAEKSILLIENTK